MTFPIGPGQIVDAAAFSRPTSAAFAEKNTVTAKTTISPTMDDDLRRKARDSGFLSTSDYLRELIRMGLYGRKHVEDLALRRVDALAQNLGDNRDDSGPAERGGA